MILARPSCRCPEFAVFPCWQGISPQISQDQDRGCRPPRARGVQPVVEIVTSLASTTRSRSRLDIGPNSGVGCGIRSRCLTEAFGCVSSTISSPCQPTRQRSSTVHEVSADRYSFKPVNSSGRRRLSKAGGSLGIWRGQSECCGHRREAWHWSLRS